MISAERIEQALDRVFTRQTQRHSWRHEDERYRLMSARERKALAQTLAAAIHNGTYEPHPARASFVRTSTKLRPLVQLQLIDRAVHAVLAEDLQAASVISEAVWSFRKGRSETLAIDAFVRYTRKHRRKHADPKQRGLYVAHVDVQKFGDSIAVHEGAPLWRILGGLVDTTLLKRALRVSKRGDGDWHSQIIGLPTGSPLLPPLENLYLSEVDHAMTSIDGAFYARYGDDMLLAHEDREVTERALLQIHTITRALGLRLHQQDPIFFNGAGRNGAHVIDYLGCRVGFDGSVSLTQIKYRRTLVELRARLRQSNTLLRDEDLRTRAQALVSIANAAFDPRSPLALLDAFRVLRIVTDRGQLAALDYDTALTLAECLSDQRGVRAFRAWPPRTLRTAFGLRSLVAMRNGS